MYYQITYHYNRIIYILSVLQQYFIPNEIMYQNHYANPET